MFAAFTERWIRDAGPEGRDRRELLARLGQRAFQLLAFFHQGRDAHRQIVECGFQFCGRGFRGLDGRVDGVTRIAPR